jgi:hypothetical protein
VELQGNLVALQKHRIQPYAISYDSVETLNAFADEHGLLYPLLSDPNSEVIRAYDIFNHLVPEGHRWYGVPFPGSYMVDPQGQVIEKSFYADHGIRDSVAAMLLEKFQDAPAGRPKQTFENDDLKATAYVSSATIRRGQVQTFMVDIELKDDRHIYAPNVKGGYTPTSLTLDSIKDVQFNDIIYPEPIKKKLVGKNVPVFENHIILKTSFCNRHRDDITIRAHLDYQACDEKECYMPQQLTFELPLIYLENV